MTNDKITPTGTVPPELLRTAPANAVSGIKREKEREGKPEDETPEEPDKPTDPEDEVVLSTHIEGFENPDNPDAYYITLDAVQDLLTDHRANYNLADFTFLQEHIAFLQSHKVVTLYWPPTLTLQDALLQACAQIMPVSD